MVLEIPLQPIPNQRLSVDLDTQSAEIELRQIGNALMATLRIDEELVFENSICGHGTPIGQFESVNFSGALVFVDQLNTDDPVFDGLGERYKLFYISKDDELYGTVASK